MSSIHFLLYILVCPLISNSLYIYLKNKDILTIYEQDYKLNLNKPPKIKKTTNQRIFENIIFKNFGFFLSNLIFDSDYIKTSLMHIASLRMLKHVCFFLTWLHSRGRGIINIDLNSFLIVASSLTTPFSIVFKFMCFVCYFT